MTEALATLLVRHRRLVVAVLALMSLLALASARDIDVRFDPDELVVVDAEVAADRDALAQAFVIPSPPIVVVLDAREHGSALLADEGLAQMHALAMRLRAIEGVERVESLTTSRLPRNRSQDTATLEDLEETAPEVEEHVRTVVLAEPERFPAGLLSIAGPVAVEAIGDEGALTAEQALDARRLLDELPSVRGRLVSRDGDVALIAAFLADGVDLDTSARALAEARRACAAYEAPGVTVEVTGLPAMRDEMASALRADQTQLVALAVIGTILVLLAGMRTVAGVLLPLGAVGIALGLTMGLMAWTGTSLNLLTNMLPPLLLTIGLAEAMHMVLRHRDEVASGTDSVAAAIEVVRTMWLPCFVTTFTTAIGFAALLVTESPALRQFGGIAAIATMLSYVVTVAFVPAALPMMGRAAKPQSGANEANLERVLLRIVDATTRRPLTTIFVASVIGIVAAAMSSEVAVESRLLDQFARGSDIARTSATLEAELDGFRTLDIGLFGDPGTFESVRGIELLDALAVRARGDEVVLRASTVSDVAHEALARLAGDDTARAASFRSDAEVHALVALLASSDASVIRSHLSADGSAARLELRLRDGGAMRTLALVQELRTAAERESRARDLHVHVRVGGEAYIASRGLERIVRALGGLAVAVVTIFVVMTLLFRSVRLGLIAIPPNALPLLVTLAYMAARGIALHAATVIVFTVTVGLAVDGTTHVVSRFREELGQGGDRSEILRRTVRGSGRAVWLSSLTLCVGYVVLLTSRFEPIRLFGELSLVAIAGATISQTVLLPAMLAIWGTPRSAQSESRPSSEEVNAASSGK
ncbi:MAG: MMPL family transporter [Deltaproteobacteria bacterium]|nr:MMPL family transporter [Deltaproteobacteria bacterium]